MTLSHEMKIFNIDQLKDLNENDYLSELTLKWVKL